VDIHPLALVSPHAQLGADVTVAPFAVIEPDVVIGAGCKIAAHAVIKNGATLGPQNEVGEHSVIGGHPQHLHKPEQLGRIVIGTKNTFREFCTVHRAMKESAATVIGNDNLFMAGSHIAHDCNLGSNIICANNILLAGYVTVEDRAFLSGAVGIHQFCRIGALAMLGGHARVVQDVPPFMMVDGQSGYICGLNLVGLRRNGYTTDQIAQLKAAYRVIYRRGYQWREALETLRTEFATGAAAVYYPFLSQGTRGFVQERRMPPNATLKLRTDGDTAASSSEKSTTVAPQEIVVADVKTKAG